MTSSACLEKQPPKMDRHRTIKGGGWTAPIVVGLLIATGCGRVGGTSAEPLASDLQKISQLPVTFRETCALVKRAEIEQVLGTKLKPPSDPSAGGLPAIRVPGMRFCQFSSSQATGPAVQVGLARSLVPEVFNKYKSEPPPKTEVQGLGDQAVYSEFAANQALVVLKGRQVLGIYQTFVKDDPQGKAKQLAAKALNRL